eukprot:CAMPEP_0206033920 /NCGR_PEP_ID=MMETSP1466-20131121/998_1 /ASSEMBLY_ACC=CAM_ASM_001126 /TAXON_ID=44452 /ORGANISM="Pavlova gyrans, Strain CCMP608" /LENGTH=316 /DNA_ID=CAMNT_0053408161 /DNA_START=93 /DNA_END=1041 /DNA_ORIENTATION=+
MNANGGSGARLSTSPHAAISGWIAAIERRRLSAAQCWARYKPILGPSDGTHRDWSNRSARRHAAIPISHAAHTGEEGRAYCPSRLSQPPGGQGANSHRFATLKDLPALVDVLGKPAETLAVAAPLHHAAHEQLDRTDVLERHLALASSEVVKPQRRAEFILRGSPARVNLVPQNQERHVSQIVRGEERVQLLLGLREALAVDRVHEEDDGVNLREVVLPHTARDLVAAKIEGAELNLPNAELLRSWVLRGHVLRQSLVLQDVEKRRLTRIVQTQEKDLRILLGEAEEVEDVEKQLTKNMAVELRGGDLAAEAPLAD